MLMGSVVMNSEDVLDKYLQAGKKAYQEYNWTVGAASFVNAMKHAKRNGIHDMRLVEAQYYLAEYYAMQRQIRRAKLFLERALETCERLNGRNSKPVSILLERLGQLFLLIGDANRAGAIFRRCTQIASSLEGPETNVVANMMLRCSLTSFAQNKIDLSYAQLMHSLSLKIKNAKPASCRAINMTARPLSLLEAAMKQKEETERLDAIALEEWEVPAVTRPLQPVP